MILLIDNYDSFTYNLFQYISELGERVVVRRNDALSPTEALGMRPRRIDLSPGPGRPESAGICVDLVRAAGSTPYQRFGDWIVGVESVVLFAVLGAGRRGVQSQ